MSFRMKAEGVACRTCVNLARDSHVVTEVFGINGFAPSESRATPSRAWHETRAGCLAALLFRRGRQLQEVSFGVAVILLARLSHPLFREAQRPPALAQRQHRLRG